MTPVPASNSASASTSTSPPEPSSDPPDPNVETPVQSEPASSTAGGAQNNNGPSAVARLLAERKIRLEKDKQAKEKAGKEERKAKADARAQSLAQDPHSAKGKQAAYALQEKKRQAEAKIERERVRRQIESDKAERREIEERRKAQAKADAESKQIDVNTGDQSNSMVDQAPTSTPKPITKSSTCALQVRLFDGSNIRSKFSSDQSLRTHVRQWIDESRSDGDAPYTLKQILTPLPNRTMSISEEEQPLQDLGFVPSSTLVMIPIQGYTAAYTNNQGLLLRGASAGYNFVSSGAGMLAGALGTFLGVGGVNTKLTAATGRAT